MFNSIFLLHGGGGGLSSLEDVQYYRKMVNPFQKKQLMVLDIPFAGISPLASDVVRQQIAESCLDHTLSVLHYVNPHKTFTGESASHNNLDLLIDQIAIADIIYVHGGNGDVLQNCLNAVAEDGLDLLVRHDKVCAGGSAGANMWATSYYSNDNSAVMAGLGILPISTFCHYNAGKWQKLNELREGNDLPIIPLGDEEYISYSLP